MWSPELDNNGYQAILVVSFGGPEKKEDVIPFLENVLRGKNVPHQRMMEVAEHYYEFGGVSPINQQNRQLIDALREQLKNNGPDLPVYWGNRNWHPMLTDTLKTMKADGITKCLALVTSAFSSYSGCRQYREDMARSLSEIDGGLTIHKLRVFYNHPGFIQPLIETTTESWNRIANDQRSTSRLLFTAHSIPNAMAENCDYEVQLLEACRLIADGAGVPAEQWQLVYQSRSGPPTQPWLEPDICDEIRSLKTEHDISNCVVVPIGFVSDHMEVLFDLDTEAKETCEELSIGFHRVPTVGTNPQFIQGLVELIRERTDGTSRSCLGQRPANHDFCPVDCCLSGRPNAEPCPTVSGADQPEAT